MSSNFLGFLFSSDFKAPKSTVTSPPAAAVFASSVRESTRMIGGGEGKAVIGLSWQPKLILPSSALPVQNTPNQSGGSLWKPTQQLVDGLYLPPNNPALVNKLRRMQVKDTLGKDWFDMPAPTITPELQKDLQILKLRGAIDPKRHYKKGDSKALPKYFQVGTVIESRVEYFSDRLTKKERKATIADELLADHVFNSYRKRKVRELEEQNRPGGKDKWKIKGRQTLKRAKERRHAKETREAKDKRRARG